MIFFIFLRVFDLEVHRDGDDPGQGKYYIPWLGSLSCGGGDMTLSVAVGHNSYSHPTVIGLPQKSHVLIICIMCLNSYTNSIS